MSLRWTGQRERGSRGALRLILWIALRLGRPAARLLLYPISLYFLVRARPQRIASRRYLGRVLARRAGMAQVGRHIHCFAATILDRVFLLSGRQDRLDIRLYHPELVLARLDAGQGFLLLGAHHGSFEVVRALAVADRHLPLKVLMYPEHNQVITQVLHALNAEIADTVIPLGRPESLLAVKEALDQGCMVGLLGDRYRPDEGSVRCDFLGGQARFPTGPIGLAAATGVPVVLFFGLYLGGNRYEVHFETLSERIELDRAGREAQIAVWVQRYAARLQHYVHRAPYNWFNFYDFWDELADAEH